MPYRPSISSWPFSGKKLNGKSVYVFSYKSLKKKLRVDHIVIYKNC